MKPVPSLIGVVLCALLVIPSMARAQTPASVRVTADRTSVRDRAASDGSVVTSVARGDQLQVVEVAGAWFKVRVAGGREGFVHSLFVERMAGGAETVLSAPRPTPTAAAPPAPAPPPAQASAQGAGDQAPRFAGDGSAPLGNRRFGVGLNNIGPSVRYWMDSKKGFQVDGYFSSNFGYSVSAISPSFIMRFKEPKAVDSFAFLPYWGAGATFWHFDDGYDSYYCGRGRVGDCDASASTIGFGGFVGSEVVFNSVPKLTLSGNVGFYSSSYGYGGIGVGLGIHYYLGGRK